MLKISFSSPIHHRGIFIVMKVVFFLLNLLIISGHAFAVVGLTNVRPVTTITTVPIVPVTVIRDEPLVLAPVDLSSLQVFSTSQYFDSCELGTGLPDNLLSLVDNLYNRCENHVREAMRQPTHAGKLNILATRACPCFQEDTTLYSLIERERQSLREERRAERERGVRSGNAPGARRGFLGLGRKDPPPGEEQVIASVNKANTHLADLRNGIMFQASILSADPQIMEGLARVYSNGFFQNATASFSNANEQLQIKFQEPRERRGLRLNAAFQIPQYDPSILSGNAPPPSCVSMRDYRAYRQYPEDPAFYQDLMNPQHQSFRKQDWSFPKLKDALSNACRDNQILTLDEAKNDPRTGWIVRRLDFLNRNPLLKNIMSGPSRNGKEEIFNLVMSTFKPQDSSCAVSGGVAHRCQQQAISKAQNFRDGLLGIFRRQDVAESVARESQEELNASLKTLPEIVTSAHVIPTAAELQVFDPATYERIRENRPAEGTITPEAQRAESVERERLLQLRFSSMNQMCPAIETSDSLNGNYVVNQLEGQWASEIETPVYNESNQSFNNAAFQEFSNNICNRGSGDDRISFDQFRRENCSGERTCANPLAEYIRRYPTGADVDQSLVFATLLENTPVASLTSTAVESVARSSGQSYRDHVSSIGSDLQSTFSGSTGSGDSQISQRTPVVSPSTSQAAAASQSTQQPPPVFVPEQVIVPMTPQETAARTEVLRNQVRESEDESRGIRDAIGDLREVMRERNENGNPGDERSMQDLNDRLAALDRRLQESERRKSSAEDELRRIALRNEELERTNGRPALAQPSAPTTRDTQVSAGGGGVARVAPVAPQSGAASGAGSVAPISPSGVSRTGPAARTPVTPASKALLELYGVEASYEQGGLIVSESGSNVDFQRLRADSASANLPISLSVEEYNRISDTNRESLRPYIDQCRALAGNVCRLSISAAGTQAAMEIFVLKSGNAVSIVQTPGAGRAVASRLPPVPVPPGVREITLDKLNTEIGTIR